MTEFIKGMKLCENFFHDCAKPIIKDNFPDLEYSAGLIGYGSDVLGYDDAVSTDHMWGPRFYLFLDKTNLAEKGKIFRILSENLPCTYEGYSVNFTKPDFNDNGVQRPAPISAGTVNPLIFIQTFDDFLTEQLGISDLNNIQPYQWLAFSEHRLLSVVSGRFFADGLHCAERISKIQYYPKDVKLYLIASNWELIASEQAFARRCGDCGDDTGSRIICARICERLMRLCFLYKNTYAPYSKWFGTAFDRLDIDDKIKRAVGAALSADSPAEREKFLIKAQALTANLHNASDVTEFVDYQIENYFGRDIQVIFAEKFAQSAAKKLVNTVFENAPLIGSFSQIGGVSSILDEGGYFSQIQALYDIK